MAAHLRHQLAAQRTGRARVNAGRATRQASLIGRRRIGRERDVDGHGAQPEHIAEPVVDEQRVAAEGPELHI